MKRVFMLLAVASMVVAAMALSGVAQADPSPGDMCRERAQSLTGSTLEGYTFVVGTAQSNIFTSSDGRNAPAEVFCGFDGGDHVMYLKGGDIFIGGRGADSVEFNSGRFYGGDGDDAVEIYNNTRFYGGDGDDSVDDTNTGRFYGGAGGDAVDANNGDFDGADGYDSVDTNLVYGAFDGDAGKDSVEEMMGGTFDGGYNDDHVKEMYNGTFDGGAGSDYVVHYYAGRLVNVP